MASVDVTAADRGNRVARGGGLDRSAKHSKPNRDWLDWESGASSVPIPSRKIMDQTAWMG
jgi:hypothetical protein